MCSLSLFKLTRKHMRTLIVFLIVLVSCTGIKAQMHFNGRSNATVVKSLPHDIYDLTSEYVKSKSLFLSLQEKSFSIPLGFGADNKTVFGATYQVVQNGTSLQYIKPKFFAMSYSENAWGELVYEKDKDLTKMNTSSRFLVSIIENGQADLHIVSFENGKFSKPEPIGDPINTPFNETSGTFTPDGQKIYFASNREGGFGGYDIYESEYVGNGRWSYPRNLGPSVNTEYDEESPYLLNDGITLYFSANGYTSRNDYDIYETILGDNGFWTEPARLEAPINTDFDDLFYQISPDEKRAIYLSSGSQGLGVYELIFY